MKDYYVYEWFNIDNGEVFYVGKGHKNRYKNTVERNDYFKNYYKKYNCDVRKVNEKLAEDEAFKIEKELIEYYRKIDQCKCNLSDGGEGCSFPEGSWNDLFRKLQYLYSVRSAMDDMPNEEEYEPGNLKKKTTEELQELYDEYVLWKESIQLLNSLELGKKSISGYELKIQNEEIVMLTDLISKSVAKDNIQFEEFLNYKVERDFICCDFNTDEFLKLMLNNMDYYRELINIIINNLWFLKAISNNPTVNIPILIKSYKIEDDFIHIKFCTTDDKTRMRVKINLYDIIWGILMFKDKALFEIIYQEIIVAPFI